MDGSDFTRRFPGDRRKFLRGAASLGAGAVLGSTALRAMAANSYMLPIGNGERPVVQYPQKRPLIVLTSRPPQLETPFEVFNEGVVTPNDAFFVRYHLAGVPTSIDLDTFRINIKGAVDTPISLSVDELKRFQWTEYYAVNQCSGNSRGLFEPRVAGGQLANGAMGNAKWRGVPLKNILDKAGVQKGAKQVTFGGVDGPVLPTTPDFAKALDIDHAMDGEVMIAYQMNDADLPMLNGYPVRLIVPGYYGTYWVKHLNEITVIDDTLKNFWMGTAYRIPDNTCACTPPGKLPEKWRPIGQFDVRLVHHQRQGRRQGSRGQAFHDPRHGLRCRLRHPRRRGVDRRRPDLARGATRQGPRQVLVPRMARHRSRCRRARGR